MAALERAEELVLEMKDTSELMVDLAMSAVLYHSTELAEEVRLLEDRIDDLYAQVQLFALQGVREGDIETDQAWALFRLSEATETIADGAREIADVVLRDVEPHPVLAASVAESDVTFARAKLWPDGALVGQTLGDVRLQSETGMHVFAVRRQGTWLLGPGGSDVLEEGDVLLASGPDQGRARMLALCGTEPPEHGDEGVEE